MRQFIVFALLLTLAFSCSKDKEPEMLTGAECLGEPVNRSTQVTCDQLFAANQNVFCELKHLSDRFMDPSSLEYLPYYCEDVFSVLRFENDNGDIERWSLLDKAYEIDHTLVGRSGTCPQDSTRSKGYCFRADRASILLEKNGSNTQLYIEIRVTVDISDPDNDDPYRWDDLSIYRRVLPRFPSYEFALLLNSDDTPFSSYGNDVFFPTIDFGGVTYSDVYTNDPPFYPDAYRYYYNKREGIVAYIDNAGVIWYRID
jgi:hypothetical protein